MYVLFLVGLINKALHTLGAFFVDHQRELVAINEGSKTLLDSGKFLEFFTN